MRGIRTWVPGRAAPLLLAAAPLLSTGSLDAQESASASRSPAAGQDRRSLVWAGHADREPGSDHFDHRCASGRASLRRPRLEGRVWEAAETRYAWRFEDDHLGLRSEGAAPARPGVRQAVGVELGALRDMAPAHRDATATLHVLAVRPDASRREAIVYLRWEGRASGYRVVGLEH